MGRRSSPRAVGPLRKGQTVAIIGGGPGGIACGLTLKQEAARRGLDLDVLLFEGKRFGVHYNQCAGVLSPPLTHLLTDGYSLALPESLVQRVIEGYILHGEKESIELRGPEYGGASLAVRRVQFDDFLEHSAEKVGVQVLQSRATDLEFREEEVVLFTWGGTFRAAAVVGAFGLSRAMIATMERRTPYRAPHVLETMVTNLHPEARGSQRVPDLLDNCIHVILPPLPRLEFGALIPKGNHVTVIIAGEDLRTDDMNAFLDLPQIHRLVPSRPEPEDYFKGRFPVSLARHPFGDRYVTIGDAAGLVRPFKGKGINSAILTGGRAARTMLDVGVSREAFRHFYRDCAEITGDLWYGRLVRALAHMTSHHFSMDPVLRVAQGQAALRELLFDCVSGRETYRRIVRRQGNLSLTVRLGALLLGDRIRQALGFQQS